MKYWAYFTAYGIVYIHQALGDGKENYTILTKGGHVITGIDIGFLYNFLTRGNSTFLKIGSLVVDQDEKTFNIS